MATREVEEVAQELANWLPNYSHEQEYPQLLWRILASLPGGEDAEDMGYEPIDGLGWHEADQLQRVIASVQDSRDVSDLIRMLLDYDDE